MNPQFPTPYFEQGAGASHLIYRPETRAEDIFELITDTGQVGKVMPVTNTDLHKLADIRSFIE